jgi:hypothetical protein
MIWFATVLAAATLTACSRPVSDPNQLKAIRAEALFLMKTHRPDLPGKEREVPKDQWPTAISHLDPVDVTVYPWGVDIQTRKYFDGGYGYEVPLNKALLPMPASCYREPSEGVFWHGPC